jgi:hypothetical protein
LRLFLDKCGMMRIAVAGREKAEVTTGQDAGQGRECLRFADGLAPCIYGALRRRGDEGLRLLRSSGFERGEIGFRPASVVAADGVDDFGTERTEDVGLQRLCELRREGRVRRL